MRNLLVQLDTWFDDRTGYRQLVHEALYEHIPGGSRWIYVTGSMLVFAFVTQAITGLFLWMAYSPGSQNAWESVYYITNEMQGGWLLRGVHHYMAQAMVVLLPLHLMQVVLCRAYTAPREINYWLGLVLMQIVMGLGLTGYLLPWDQKGYWATKVATELMSLPPVVGPYLQTLAVGGGDYGNATLTRFFAMHAGVLPALLVAVLGLHLAMFRKHGITAESSPKREDEFFWPPQVFKDGVACLLLFVIVMVLAIVRVAELGPPAEPTEAYGAARPEWYFLFLFQLLKWAPSEFIGAIVIPGLAMGFLFLMPLIARVRYGHFVNVAAIVVMVLSAAYLTYEAIDHDNYHTRHGDSPPSDPAQLEIWTERVQAAKDFHEAKALAHHEYERTVELVEFYGIPPQGATLSIVHDDPEIQGPRIFKKNCASCHSYDGDTHVHISGPKPPGDFDTAPTPYGAPNLGNLMTDDWIAGMLDPERIGTADFFGATAHGIMTDGSYKSGGMAEFVVDNISAGAPDEDLQALIQVLSAEASLPGQATLDDTTIEKGREALINGYGCTGCHKFHDEGDVGSGAPDLTGYRSHDWLYDFIANAGHDRFYGDNNDRMQAYAEHPDNPSLNLLSEHDIDMLVRWLRGTDRDLHAKLERDQAAAEAVADVVEEPTAANSTPEADPTPQPTETEGARLFRTRCGRCHPHADADGNGIAGPTPRDGGKPNGAPNLHRFASREWLTGLLDPERIATLPYFGNTAHGQQDDDGAFKSGGMAEWVHDNLTDLDDEGKQDLSKLIVALSAEAQLGYQQEADQAATDDGTLEAGRAAVVDRFSCIDCHRFRDEGDLGAAPDLAGYGSREWLIGMISDPEHERFYPDSNDRMPAFQDQLSSEEIGAIADFIRGAE